VRFLVRENNGVSERVGTEIVRHGGVRLPAPLRERLEGHARASKAQSTWKAYAVDWAVWEAWAGAHGMSSLPARPVDVAAFLSDAAATKKLATLKRYLAAISVCHTLSGEAFDRKSGGIKIVLKGIARTQGADPRRVKPLMSAAVRGMLATMGPSPKRARIRDAALLALGVASGCRRSELCALDWLTRGDGNGVLELTEHGATIRLFTSKTSQDKEAQVHLQDGPALAAVRAWVAAGAIEPSTPLFRGVDRHGNVGATRLHPSSVARVVKARASALGLEATDYSGHSLRSGMITSAAEAGVPEWRIGLTSRHSPKGRELQTYIRPVEARRQALTNEIDL
jgi:integrase